MQTSYRLNANELTPDFVRSIQTLFGMKPIEIIVMDAPTENNESTEYLFGNEVNREHLLQLMDEVERGENLIQIPLDTLEKML
ncbi:MAG: hypothetical protein MUF71_10780 [Candidatus Kapabacteria bacterium]|nr:hypothetical protein [Candidatus Kapabacteria bacterium]